MREIPSYHLLGLRVDALALQDLQAIATDAVENAVPCLIANHNLHSVYLYHHDAKMRTFYGRAQHVLIDGMPLILLGKSLGYPLRREHRSGSIDWVIPLMGEAARRGWRVFHLGSEPGVARRGAEVLRGRFPGLQISTAHGYFDADPGSVDTRKVLERINDYRPDILTVGMGMPRQEHWIADNLENIEASLVLNVGAYIDFVAGVKPTPPRWMGLLSVEWLYRLYTEPRRLWRRYLLEPWFILGLILRRWVKRDSLKEGP